MKTGIIIPTINVPLNLNEWSAMLDPNDGDFIIVVGSQKTPHAEVERYLDSLEVNTLYMHPESEVSTKWHVNEFLAPNHHHRRNLALAEALTHRPDIVVTIDDDNYPRDLAWLSQVKDLITLPNTRRVMYAPDGWWNVGELCEPAVTHRGYPLTQRLVDTCPIPTAPDNEKIGVVASLWTDDPDIDAIERIAIDPQVHYITHSVTLDIGTWSPFDTQSTTVSGALAPLMYMWTNVGRYDDIWCSYLMRAVMDAFELHVTYGAPTVRQRRNEHDLVKDLENELLGYRHTEELCDFLRNVSSDIKDVLRMSAHDEVTPPTLWQAWKEAVDMLRDRNFSWLPPYTVRGMLAWIKDMEGIGIK